MFEVNDASGILCFKQTVKHDIKAEVLIEMLIVERKIPPII